MNHTQEEHIKMMQTPDDWPNMVLPVKRSTNESGGYPYEVGLIRPLGWTTAEPSVYLANMFDTFKWEDVEKRQYESFEQMYDDGWRVD